MSGKRSLTLVCSLAFSLLPAAPAGAQSLGSGPAACVAGLAGRYPCRNVDLMARIPYRDLTTAPVGGSELEGSDVWGWTDPRTGKEYAIANGQVGIAFVDVSDPAAPVLTAELRFTGITPPQIGDLKVYRKHAFIVGDGTPDHGMLVFNLRRLGRVTDPPATFREPDAHYTGFGDAHNLAINEETGFAYAVATDTCDGGLHMVDIRDPKNPRHAGCFAADGRVHDVQCVIYRGPDATYRGREICFASAEGSLTLVDVTDKSSPRLLSRTAYEGMGYVHQGWLTEDHAHFLLDDELDEINFGHNTRTYVWDVGDLENPILVGLYTGTTTATDHNLYVKGDYVYEANYRAGLRILHLDDVAAAELSEVAVFDIDPDSDESGFSGAWTAFPFFDSGTVVMSTRTEGLFVLRPTLCMLEEGATSYCRVCGPCAAGAGHCRSDDECGEGLVCAEKFGADVGLTPSTNICVAPASQVPATRQLTEIPALSTGDGELGTVRAVALNNTGQVAGSATDGARTRAFRYSPDTGMEAVDPTGESRSTALAMAEDGTVFGTILNAGGRQLRLFLAGGEGEVDLLENGLTGKIRRRFQLSDMNERGDLVGVVNLGGRLVPYRYTGELGWEDLSRIDPRFAQRSTWATAINDRRHVVLTVPLERGLQDTYLLRRNGQLLKLGHLGRQVTLPGALGASTQVVGLSETRQGAEHAFLYEPDAGLRDLHRDGFTGSLAGWVTSQGVVGLVLAKTRPEAIFTDDGRRSKRLRKEARRSQLKALLPPESDFRGIEVIDMNERVELIGRVNGELDGVGVERFFYVSPPTGVVDVADLLSGAGSSAAIVDLIDLNDRGAILLEARRPDGTTVPVVLTP